MINRIYVLLLFFVVTLGASAQIDTSFWFVAPDISATLGDNPINLHVQTYNQAATVYVRQPANAGGVNATLTINANTISVLPLSGSIAAVESAPVNSVSSKGIYISSNQKVSVYYTIGAASNKEMISLKGSRSIGSDFYIPVPNSLTTATTYTDGGVGFDLVATKSGTTTVLITPRANCVGHTKNVTYALSLTQGQTYSLRDNNGVNPSELAGTIVSSDSAIAITVSGIVLTTPTTCTSYYADQITSSSNIGTDYVVLRGDGATDIAYILSTLNSTSLSITSGTNVTNSVINFGETFSVNATPNPITYIKSNQPIYVLHTSGYGCKMSGAQVPPVYCAGSYTAAFPRLSNDSLNLNIYTRTGYQNSFTLTSDGVNVPVPGANFTVVPGTGGALSAARIYFSTVSIAPGSNNILSNSQDLFGLGVINGGTSGGSSYAYASEFGSSTFAHANAVASATICSNTNFTLNGQVGGGPITGYWSFNGLGTLSGPNTQLTNNIYTPNPLDTNITPVKIVLNTTGICPNKSDTLKLTVKQAPLVNAGTDQIICSNNATVQLNGIILGPTNQGVWNIVAPGGGGTFSPNPNIINPVYNASNADTALPKLKFVLTSTNNAGCNAVNDTVVVWMNKAPVVKASTINPIVKCSNNPNIFLNGSVSGTVTSTGSWTTSGTGFFTPNNLSLICNYIPSAADLAAGSVVLKLTSMNNQQCKAVSDSVTVNFTQPATVNVGVDLNSCKNNPVVNLNAVIGGTLTNTGIWYGGGGSFSPTNTALTPTYVASAAEIAAGFVILTFSTTNNGLCFGVSDQLRIDFQDKPTANFTVNAVCLNQSTYFTNTSINTGSGSINGWQWNFGDGSTSTFSAPASTYTSAGTFTAQLVVSNNFGCSDTVSRPVTIYPLPTASLQISRSCHGSSQLITFKDRSTVAAPDSIPPTGYQWDFGGVNGGISFAKDTNYLYQNEGTYNITHQVTTVHGCKTIITQSLNITPKPVARFNINNNSAQSLVTNVSFQDTSISAVSWSWDFGNNSVSNIQNPSTTYSTNGQYTVHLTVTDQFGCDSSTFKVVNINNVVSELTQLIPNMISPNNDGKNDVWRLDFINVFFPAAEIEIYNRWGDQLFRSVGYSNAWDGSYKGAPLPVGVYFYVIKLNDPSDTNIYKGTITLLK